MLLFSPSSLFPSVLCTLLFISLFSVYHLGLRVGDMMPETDSPHWLSSFLASYTAQSRFTRQPPLPTFVGVLISKFSHNRTFTRTVPLWHDHNLVSRTVRRCAEGLSYPSFSIILTMEMTGISDCQLSTVKSFSYPAMMFLVNENVFLVIWVMWCFIAVLIAAKTGSALVKEYSSW